MKKKTQITYILYQGNGWDIISSEHDHLQYVSFDEPGAPSGLVIGATKIFPVIHIHPSMTTTYFDFMKAPPAVVPAHGIQSLRLSGAAEGRLRSKTRLTEGRYYTRQSWLRIVVVVRMGLHCQQH